METKNNGKVLVVFDRTYRNNRTDKQFKHFETMISECLSNEGYETDFHIFTSFCSEYDYDISIDSLMKEIDDLSAHVCMHDYATVIVEGFAAWFWLLAMYSIPAIYINPVIEPISYFEDFMTDDMEYYLDDLISTRGFQTSECMCVIDYEHADDVEEYDNTFMENTVVVSDYDISDKEFWTDTNSVMKALNYIIENYD